MNGVDKEIEVTFFLGGDGIIYENTDEGRFLYPLAPRERVRIICQPSGTTTEETRENAEFLLMLLNNYANREITEKDLEAAQ
jgi:hypothetical protein